MSQFIKTANRRHIINVNNIVSISTSHDKAKEYAVRMANGDIYYITQETYNYIKQRMMLDD